ncbi:MAG: preprotein translocase subunit YajC [Bifidobacterium sp.]|nr:preprotein translocase subunit YajC [Bifidobacterium sp.]
MEYMFLIILLVFMIAMMVYQSRKAKKQQEERKNFWSNLAPGTEIITIGALIGKVVEVDEEYEEIVLESEGSPMRFSFRAISKEYVRPAYVHDDEVDEQGNPLPKDGEQAHTETAQGQEPAQIAPADGEQVVEEDVEAQVVEEEPQAQQSQDDAKGAQSQESQR